MGEQIKSLIDRIVKLENDKASLASKLNNIPKPIASVNKEILAGNKYHSICTMKFRPGLNKNLFDLKMISVEYKQKCVKFLGYSIDELENAWSIGKWFPPKKHPIFDIMRKPERKKYRKLNMNITGLFKFFDPSWTPVIPLVMSTTYIHKQGHDVNAMFYARLNLLAREVEIRTTFNYASDKN